MCKKYTFRFPYTIQTFTSLPPLPKVGTVGGVKNMNSDF